MNADLSGDRFQAAWQAAETYQRRLTDLCEPPEGQPLDRAALAAAARELPAILQELRSTLQPAAGYPPAESAVRQKTEYLAALHETTLELISQLDLGQLLENIVRRAGQLMGTDSGYLDLIEPGTDELKPKVGLGALTESLNHAVVRGEGLAGRVWETGQPVVVDDYDRWPGRIGAFSTQAIRAIVGVPLLSGGRVAGVLGLAYAANSERTFGPEALEVLNQFARLAVVAIENARLYTARRDSEMRYRDLFENSPVALWEQDFSGIKLWLDSLHSIGVTDLRAYLAAHPALVQGVMRLVKVLDVNQAAVKLYGACTKEELMGRLMEVVEPLPEADILGGVMAINRGDPEYEGVAPNRRLTGEIIDVSRRWFIPGRRAEEWSHVIVALQDVTEQRQAEAELRTSEERYRALAESIPDLIYILDRDQKVQYVNALAAQALNRPAAEVIGLSQSVLFPRDTAEAHAADVAQIFATGQGLSTEERLPLPGGEIWIDSRLTPLRDASGEIVAVLGISRDVTERKKMEQALREERASLARRVEARTAELNAANAELVRAMRAKDDFLATMSHELRTPLTGILGLSESLGVGTYGPVSDRQARSLQMIYASGEHLLALITDVLDLAKIGAEKLELRVEWVGVDDICQSSLRLINPQAGKKNIHLRSRYDPAVSAVRADGRRLKQMLLNLLGNAVKFTPDGGTIGLEVTGDVDRQRALFTVWDTGIGISREDVQRLFQPFMQVDNSLARRYEGAGLGLALVRRLAELHGGSVTVESEPGRGSRFTVALPWHPTDLPADIESAAGLAPAPETSPSGAASSALAAALPKLILLAEDNDLLARTFVDALQVRGYQVVLAQDGLEALNLARQRPPDLALMDIQMPGLGGLETIRRMRADPTLCQIPVIALTALTMPGDREACLAAGASDYLSKPVKWSELLRKIRYFLAEEEGRRG